MAHSFNERIRAFQDAVRMKKNPYVPFFSNDGFWRIYDAGYKLSEVVYDYDKALDALLTYAKRYDVDTFLDIGDRNPLQISEVLGNKEYIIDDEHNTLVIKEQCHMTEDDYDKAAESPLAFLWENILVSKYSNFNKDMTPELLQAAMGKFLEWNQRMKMAKAALREQCGVVPCNDGAHGGGPLFVGIEAYYDVYRGMKNLAKDMRRRPEKLKAACDAFFTAFVQPSVDNIQHVEDPQGAFYASMYTLCANLLSKKQIEEFLVPQAKIITEKIVETDNTLYILCEGTTRNIDDFLQDLPAGHFCLYVVSTR